MLICHIQLRKAVLLAFVIILSICLMLFEQMFFFGDLSVFNIFQFIGLNSKAWEQIAVFFKV